jgi:hypothetical protein
MNVNLGVVGGFVAAQIAPQENTAHNQYQDNGNNHNVPAAV